MRRVFWTVDLAITTTERSDYNVFCRWHWNRTTLTLMQGVRFRAQWPNVKQELIKTMAKYPKEKFVFPTQFLEILAVQSLKNEGFGRQMDSVSLPGDKVSRATHFAELAKCGNVVVYKGLFGDMFVREHVGFPDTNDHDDCVDCSSIATHYLGMHQPTRFLVAKQERPERKQFKAY